MLMVIVASLLGLLVASSFFIYRRESKGTTKTSKLQPIEKDLKTYTKAEVSKHNSRRDCWIIVKDKIYDVTPYVEEHPGGDAILNHAGGDSTEGFYGPQHATRVFDMIDEFYVGDVKVSVFSIDEESKWFCNYFIQSKTQSSFGEITDSF